MVDNNLTHKRKLKKAIDLTTQNICREVLTELEIFNFSAKAFFDSPEKTKALDEVFERIRNRVFDISGQEARRLKRFLEGWNVEQVENYDWVEYGDRLK